MKDIKGCIFDLDGVIVDTAKYHYLAWKRLANELGFDFTEQDNERLKGVSRMTSLDILLEIGKTELTEERKIELATKKNEWYREFILKMEPDEILPGALDLLKELKEKKIGVALGSASKNAPTILEKVKLTEYFDAVVDGNMVAKAKPDPSVFLQGADLLGVKKEECIVFEDAEAGIEAAINGGMRNIGIGSPDVLVKADIVLPGLDGLNLNKLKSLFCDK